MISVTLVKEAIDDFQRKVNSATYPKLTSKGWVSVPSSSLMVGDVVEVGGRGFSRLSMPFVQVGKGVRAPAELVLLRTTEQGGACVIWAAKHRLSVICFHLQDRSVGWRDQLEITAGSAVSPGTH